MDKAIGVAECVDSDSDDDSIPEGYVVSEDEEGLDALEPTFATNASSSSAAAMALGGVDGKSVANDRAQLLERVSSEMGRLRFLQTKGKKLPFVRSMAPRIDACEESLAEAVASVLEDALSAPVGARDRSRVEHCLRAHVAMDRVSEAEDAIARVLVQPAVAKVTGSASAETTFPSANSPLLIWIPSWSRAPSAPVRVARSLPARSTRLRHPVSRDPEASCSPVM